ncbi:hypothetical protein QUA54_20305 [Microcoleus sp. MOSTC5]|uniref:hypothetical protein n=1 Tax=Microcoleus sp. MOSTC5 TaxID=3055378 RepID=UPI002FD0B431
MLKALVILERRKSIVNRILSNFNIYRLWNYTVAEREMLFGGATRKMYHKYFTGR